MYEAARYLQLFFTSNALDLWEEAYLDPDKMRQAAERKGLLEETTFLDLGILVQRGDQGQ